MRIALAPTLALATSLLALSSTTQAQTYLQGNLGTSRLSADCTGVVCDKKSVGLKLVFGHRYADNVGFEASYIRFGSFTARTDVGGVPVSAKLRGQSLGLSGVWRLPLGQNAEAALRVGGAINRATATVQAVGLTDRARETKLRALIGMGLGYQLTPTTSVGVEFDTTRFPFDGEASTMRLFSVYARTEF